MQERQLKFTYHRVIEVELFALWRVILELEELNVERSTIEGDSKVVVVGWPLDSLCPWIYLDKTEWIQHSYHFFWL